jgi:hypothetical protein
MEIGIFHKSLDLLFRTGQSCSKTGGESAAHFGKCGFIHGDNSNGVQLSVRVIPVGRHRLGLMEWNYRRRFA